MQNIVNVVPKGFTLDLEVFKEFLTNGSRATKTLRERISNQGGVFYRFGESYFVKNTDINNFKTILQSA